MTLRMTVLYPIALAAAVATAAGAQQPAAKSPAMQGLDQLKALQGEWIDVDGAFGVKGAVAASYRVTSGGHSVVETFPIKTAFEMTTVYHVDGNDLVLTHYCADNTQPRMRSKGLAGRVLAFDYDGGTNIDVAKTNHMHTAKLEFVSADEIRGTWQNWSGGKPGDHVAAFHLVRKK